MFGETEHFIAQRTAIEAVMAEKQLNVNSLSSKSHYENKFALSSTINGAQSWLAHTEQVDDNGETCIEKNLMAGTRQGPGLACKLA
eukprot:306555-Pleurochrysis_carterae.AAC.1